MTSNLAEYRRKRDFERTAEPAPATRVGVGPLTFVVQKHRARALHYDFRLELDGVLKSWAVPKGPSLDPAEKHLAVMVEDHPLDYASFEGVIPKGEYGAGQVIVWDRGTYSPDEGGQFLFADRQRAEAVMRADLEKGKVSVFLRGEKLQGSFTLVKVARGEKDWLLMKHRDEHAQPGFNILTEERSVLSGRTTEEVRSGLPAPAPNAAEMSGARPAPFPGFVPPMLAQLASGPFSHPDWFFEPKLDGYRTIASIDQGKVRLWSRRGLDVSSQYARLLPDLERQPAASLVLDGEIVAMDKKGRVCFQCLQRYLQSLRPSRKDGSPQVSLIYYVFDVLYLDGTDLRDVSLRERKKVLQSVLRPTDAVRMVDFFERDGEAVYRAAVQNGLEGAMAKQAASRYESGRRSSSWLKVKATQTGEFIIAGYTAGERARSKAFGALLLGYRDDAGKLVYAGHVGTGFDETLLEDLKKTMDPVRTERCPFETVPATNAPATWLRPELVAEIKYSQWTADGRLRAPVFLRLREDKSPEDVRRPQVVASPGQPAEAPQPERPAEDILAQLARPVSSLTLTVNGKRVSLTNLDKELWRKTGADAALTKRDFLKYLTRVSPYLLPHLKDRPLTLSRYPNGIDGEHFWQKHWTHPLPDYVTTVNIMSEETDKPGEYIVCDNLPTLLWLGQLADIELHTWFSRISPEPELVDPKQKRDTEFLLDRPDFIIFDLDPYIYSGQEAKGAEPELNRKAFDRGCQVALWLKEVLDRIDLAAFIKTSGKTGLHVYVPIVRKLDYAAVRKAAETIGQFLLKGHPADITMEWAPAKRTGRVFFDYAQNVRGKTLACAYSARPLPLAPVSMPLPWTDLGKVYPTDFTILTVPDHLERAGDPWKDILASKRDLAEALGKTK